MTDGSADEPGDLDDAAPARISGRAPDRAATTMRPGHHASLSVVAPMLFLVMWSSGAIFVKLGLMSSSVWTFLAVRSIGATLVLSVVLLVAFRSDFRAALALPGRTVLWAISVGLLLQAGYQGAYFLAIAHGLSPSTLTIILGAQPLLTPWIARERVPWRGMVLLLAAFLGLVLAVVGTRAVGDGSVSGVGFGVIALLAITVGTALQKQIGVAVARSIVWQYIGSALVFGTVVAVTGWRATLDVGFLISAAWMILVVSVGANVLLLYLLSRHQASKIGVVFYFVPIVTMIGEHYIYGTPQSAETVIGAAILVLSSLAFARLDRYCRIGAPADRRGRIAARFATRALTLTAAACRKSGRPASRKQAQSVRMRRRTSSPSASPASGS